MKQSESKARKDLADNKQKHSETKAEADKLRGNLNSHVPMFSSCLYDDHYKKLQFWPQKLTNQTYVYSQNILHGYGKDLENNKK